MGLLMIADCSWNLEIESIFLFRGKEYEQAKSWDSSIYTASPHQTVPHDFMWGPKTPQFWNVAESYPQYEYLQRWSADQGPVVVENLNKNPSYYRLNSASLRRCECFSGRPTTDPLRLCRSPQLYSCFIIQAAFRTFPVKEGKKELEIRMSSGISCLTPHEGQAESTVKRTT